MICTTSSNWVEINEARVQLKKKFLNSLYHEIRTPLNGLLGFLELISELQSKLNNEREPRIEEEYFQTVKNCSERFLQTMNSIIQLAQLNAGDKQIIVKEHIKVEEIVADLKVLLSRTQYKSRPDIRFEFTIENADLMINTDKKMLTQVLYHAIDGMTRISGKLKIRVGCKQNSGDQKLQFYIRRRGWRQNSQEIPRIFEPFNNEDSIKHSVEGFGVGLPLAKKLIGLIDGDITFDRAKGRARMNCWIPIKDRCQFES